LYTPDGLTARKLYSISPHHEEISNPVAHLVGHERGFTFSVYSPLGLDLKGLQRVVETISYEGLSLKHLDR